ncbi:dihydropteroate synthase [Sphaerotilus uruguayifluvii]|uniref:Dihydropteroate synthase n=1 Tax=Sphaerotilus uruguayifluvii TaxID=2735897 RepID=A0ABX2G6Y8_9BURK|nr:dihydropteroate synthase [Leptothrix sp. C29]NRT57177.1 dihydropteroate synthase [Leptothrix sp. C29]
MSRPDSAPVWRTTRHAIDLGRVRIMGIVNATPDSFSDGGRDLQASLRHCETLLGQGADILDIGGESTRPGSEPVPEAEEWARVEPVLRHALTLGVAVSVDTCKPGVMRRALDLGVDIVNDVAALRAPGAVDAVAAHPSCGLCLMHMTGEPRTMQHAPHHDDVVAEVAAHLAGRVAELEARGVGRARIVLDPGIGFGKRVEDNFALIRGQQALLALGLPVLAGWSRKSSLGVVTGGRPVGERMVASVAAALAAAHCGARVVRVHDVAETADALKVWTAAGLLPGSPDQLQPAAVN